MSLVSNFRSSYPCKFSVYIKTHNIHPEKCMKKGKLSNKSKHLTYWGVPRLCLYWTSVYRLTSNKDKGTKSAIIKVNETTSYSRYFQALFTKDIVICRTLRRLFTYPTNFSTAIIRYENANDTRKTIVIFPNNGRLRSGR